ncbi:MAG: NAD(P)H-dependent oxidoreductase [Crocinitomicaceae bacterium]|nr:NAD(P)H-dependent oxidoreductase [Crocinitomicaceae bacterium]
MKKIIAFSGSNSKTSINQQLIEAIASSNEQMETLNLRDYEAPLYGIDIEEEIGIPETMTLLKQKIKDADGILVSCPEHNGSMPAVLKNTIDWLSRIEPKVFEDKPTVFLSTSPGPRGGVSALEHLVAVMPYRGANIVGSLSIGSFQDHYANGVLSEEVTSKLNPIIEDLKNSM